MIPCVSPSRGPGSLRGMNRSPHSRSLTAAAPAGLAATVLGAAVRHVGWARQVDTVRHAVSDYAPANGAGRVFAGTVASLTAGSAALLAGLVRSRLPIGAPATALLGTWCGGLALAGICPPDPLGAAPTPSGRAHRYAAGAAMAALPAVGLLAARRLQRLPGWAARAGRAEPSGGPYRGQEPVASTAAVVTSAAPSAMKARPRPITRVVRCQAW